MSLENKHERVGDTTAKSVEHKQPEVVDRMLEALSRIVNDPR